MALRKIWCLPLDATSYNSFQAAWYSGEYWREVAIKDMHGDVIVVKKTVQAAAQALNPKDLNAGLCRAAHFAAHMQCRAVAYRGLALWRWLRRSGRLKSEVEAADEQEPEHAANPAAGEQEQVAPTPAAASWSFMFKTPSGVVPRACHRLGLICVHIGFVMRSKPIYFDHYDRLF